MPSFYIAPELFTRIEYTIVVILVMDRSSQAVAEHAFSERWKGIDGVLFEEGSGRGRITFRSRDIRIRWCSELVEFVFS